MSAVTNLKTQRPRNIWGQITGILERVVENRKIGQGDKLWGGGGVGSVKCRLTKSIHKTLSKKRIPERSWIKGIQNVRIGSSGRGDL